MRYCSLKSPAFWPDQTWTITQEPGSSQICGFCRNLEDNWHFYIQVKKIHINGLDFVKTSKTSFLGPFWDFLRRPEPEGLFFKNRTSSLFSFYDYLTSCKKIRKNWSANLEILGCATLKSWTSSDHATYTEPKICIHMTFTYVHLMYVVTSSCIHWDLLTSTCGTSGL